MTQKCCCSPSTAKISHVIGSIRELLNPTSMFKGYVLMYHTCAYYLTIVLAFTFCSSVKTEVYNTSIYKGNVMNELNKFVTSLLKANMLPDLQAAVRRLRDLKAGHSGRTKLSNAPGENIDDFSFVPRFPCDKFDEISRSCINNRQIGTTLTVGVRLDTKDEKNLWKKYVVRWFRYFKY
ncbi:UNVERIFIED_CONTAM: hypothetical protein NCL1_40126 [Trichonephila clavipes]